MDLRHIFAVSLPKRRDSDSRSAGRCSEASPPLLFPCIKQPSSGVTATEREQACISTSAGDKGSRMRMRCRLEHSNQEMLRPCWAK